MWDFFKKRDIPLPDVYQYKDLPERFRYQVVWMLRDTFGRAHTDFYKPVWEIACREEGVPFLIDKYAEPGKDFCAAILQSGDTKLVLSLIELAFRSINLQNWYYHAKDSELGKRTVFELNCRFREHGLGYEFLPESGQIIRKDNEFTHTEQLLPALKLLHSKNFKSANDEFLEAFEDYRAGDYGDCLTKCCSAFESTIKIIGNSMGWGFSGKETSSALVERYADELNLDAWMKQHLQLPAIIRNKLSKSHGAGVTPKNPNEATARYALGITASTIVFLVETSGV